MISQFVELLATFIGEGPYATNIAWGVTIILLLFALWLLRWLFNWFFKANEIIANQEHIIELLEARVSAPFSARPPMAASPTLNMRPPSPIAAASSPAQVRQHPIDEEFSEILNVRPHNLRNSSSATRQSPVPPVFTPTSSIPASPAPASPAPVSPVPVSPMKDTSQVKTQSVQPIAIPSAFQKSNEEAETTVKPVVEIEDKSVVAVQAKPANTSVTMLGSPEARAERQMEAREAMRLAAEAASSTLSKTADIPDIPTALVRTYSPSKTNPLTGRRVPDRSTNQAEGENEDDVPSQFQLRNRKS